MVSFLSLLCAGWPTRTQHSSGAQTGWLIARRYWNWSSSAFSHARSPRAQALAYTNGTAFEISKGLIRQKLNAQEQLAGEQLQDSGAVDLIIANQEEAVDEAQTIEALRLSVLLAAHAYWSAWRNLPVIFPKRDLSRAPEHWQRFGARISPLTGSPRLSVNPPKCYAQLPLCINLIRITPGRCRPRTRSRHRSNAR